MLATSLTRFAVMTLTPQPSSFGFQHRLELDIRTNFGIIRLCQIAILVYVIPVVAKSLPVLGNLNAKLATVANLGSSGAWTASTPPTTPAKKTVAAVTGPMKIGALKWSAVTMKQVGKILSTIYSGSLTSRQFLIHSAHD